MENKKYYSLFPKSDLFTQASKVNEDRIFYNKLGNWGEIVNYFNKIYQKELDLGVSENTVEKWHDMLRTYLSHKPGDEDTIAFTTGMGFPIERSEEILRVIHGARIREVEQIELDFYDHFESLL